MLDEVFNSVYEKFKLNFYRNVFNGFKNKTVSLTALEILCLEVIHELKNVTLNDLANFLNISQPNLAYKISNLVKKGYVKKIQSKIDKREYFLEVTDKFYEYYETKNQYINLVLDRLKEHYSEDEIEKITEVLTFMNEDLMPEISEVINKNAR